MSSNKTLAADRSVTERDFGVDHRNMSELLDAE
jgi:hypothetical protein